MNILKLFCEVDDFWQGFKGYWQHQLIENGEQQRQRAASLTMSEIMTLVVLFHQSGYRHFKGFYVHYVCQYLKREFPNLVSYTRFVELQGRTLIPLTAYLQSRCRSTRGIAFIDATTIAVCHNRRIPQHRVFAGIAQRGKTSMGWFYGFKVHLVVNDQGDLIAFAFTPGNMDDRQPVLRLTAHLFGKLFGDKGYLSAQLAQTLLQRGLELITALKKNMQPRTLPAADQLLLRKRAIIETINDQLKNISQIEHSRHRSFHNFLLNLVAALVAYTHQDKKPALHFEDTTALVIL